MILKIYIAWLCWYIVIHLWLVFSSFITINKFGNIASAIDGGLDIVLVFLMSSSLRHTSVVEVLEDSVVAKISCIYYLFKAV